MAISKTIKTQAGAGRSLRKTVAYLMDAPAHNSERERYVFASGIGFNATDSASVVAAMSSVPDRFGKKLKNECYHVVESFAADELDADNDEDVMTAHLIGLEFARETWAGRMVLVVLQRDSAGGFLHCHFVVNNLDTEQGKAARGDTMRWLRYSPIHDAICRKHGVTQDHMPTTGVAPELKTHTTAYDRARIHDGGYNAKLDLQARASAVKAVATSWDQYTAQCKTVGIDVEVIPAGGPRRFTSVRHGFTGTDGTAYAWTSRDLGKGLGHAALTEHFQANLQSIITLREAEAQAAALAAEAAVWEQVAEDRQARVDAIVTELGLPDDGAVWNALGDYVERFDPVRFADDNDDTDTWVDDYLDVVGLEGVRAYINKNAAVPAPALPAPFTPAATSQRPTHDLSESVGPTSGPDTTPTRVSVFETRPGEGMLAKAERLARTGFSVDEINAGYAALSPIKPVESPIQADQGPATVIDQAQGVETAEPARGPHVPPETAATRAVPTPEERTKGERRHKATTIAHGRMPGDDAKAKERAWQRLSDTQITRKVDKAEAELIDAEQDAQPTQEAAVAPADADSLRGHDAGLFEPQESVEASQEPAEAVDDPEVLVLEASESRQQAAPRAQTVHEVIPREETANELREQRTALHNEIRRLGKKIEWLGFSALASSRDPNTLAEIESAKQRKAQLERTLSELAGDRKPAARPRRSGDGVDGGHKRQDNDLEPE